MGANYQVLDGLKTTPLTIPRDLIMNIDIPDTLIALLNWTPEKFKEFVALCMYEKELVTMRHTANLANLTLSEFIELMAEHGVPNNSSINIERQNNVIDELMQEGHFDDHLKRDEIVTA